MGDIKTMPGAAQTAEMRLSLVNDNFPAGKVTFRIQTMSADKSGVADMLVSTPFSGTKA
jgi:hypothetical protein